jgi:hypothetical protein
MYQADSLTLRTGERHGCKRPGAFLKTLLPQILASQAYRSGRTAVFVVWDEDSFIPNIVIAPSVIPGTSTSTAVNHYGLLRATEEMLGLPLLGNAAGATSLRTVFHIQRGALRAARRQRVTNTRPVER